MSASLFHMTGRDCAFEIPIANDVDSRRLLANAFLHCTHFCADRGLRRTLVCGAHSFAAHAVYRRGRVTFGRRTTNSISTHQLSIPREQIKMSRKHNLVFAAALMVGTASLTAADAATVQLVQSHVANINRCRNSLSHPVSDSFSYIDRTCLSAACMSLDFGHVQRTVGPTNPVGCR